MTESLSNSQDGQKNAASEQQTGAALNGDIEMSEDVALPVSLPYFLPFLSSYLPVSYHSDLLRESFPCQQLTLS